MWLFSFVLGIFIGMFLVVLYMISCNDEQLENLISQIKNIRKK